MKTILTSLLLATAAMFNVSCNGQTVLEQAKTVRAYSPDKDGIIREFRQLQLLK